MGGFTVGDLVTLACSQREALAIGEGSLQFSFEAKNDVSLRTPVIGCIAWRVFHHANANLSESLRSPESYSGLSWVLGRHDLGPIRG